jgi:hypothetical protein
VRLSVVGMEMKLEMLSVLKESMENNREVA